MTSSQNSGSTAAVTGPLKQWIGRSETVVDTLHPVALSGLSATLDTEPFVPCIGQPVPALWHWVFFLPQAPAHTLGPDGHPRRGDFLPPVALPRRMWAGSRFVFNRPLYVGETIQRISTVESIAGKKGRSGELTFVTVRHDYHAHSEEQTVEEVMTEWHDIVYRDKDAASFSASIESKSASTTVVMPQMNPEMQHGPCERQPDGSICQRWYADSILLFRYSALTFNGHRIHYDRSYATQTEGYPGLVVHGPLLATLLVDLIRTQWPQKILTAYRFKALHPVFDIHPFTLYARQVDARTIILEVLDWQGRCAMQACASCMP